MDQIKALMKQDYNKLALRKDGILPTSRDRKTMKLNPVERAIALKRMEQDVEVLQPTPMTQKRPLNYGRSRDFFKTCKSNHLYEAIK